MFKNLFKKKEQKQLYVVDFDKIKTYEDLKAMVKLLYIANNFFVEEPTKEQKIILKRGKNG